MILKLAAATVVAGVAASLAVSSPALAATAPTLATPAVRAGWGTITLTGTAAPGATVQLFETAIVFNDLDTACTWLGVDAPAVRAIVEDLRGGIRAADAASPPAPT